MTAYEIAKEQTKNIPRPSTQEFIDFAKNNFTELGLIWGNGFVVHAVEIAEELLDVKSRCSNCGMVYCECEEQE
jgi:hypothetical protein